MSEFVAGMLGWMLAELWLTGSLFILYVGLRRFVPVAADRYFFLKLTFAVVVVLPWLSFPWDILISNETPTTTSVLASTIVKIRPTASNARSFWEWVPSILVVSYFASVAFFLARLGSSLFKLRLLAKQSQFAFTYKGIDVRVTDENISPATFGLLNPVILIPRATLEQLSEQELQMILVHERYHIDRRDYAFNLLKAVVQSVLVFSPFVHKLAKAFVEDMELSCDAFVVSSRTCGVKDYGRLLLRLATETRPRMDLVYSGLFVSNSFISTRITAMKSPNLKTRRFLSGAAFAFFAIIVGPTVASLGLENAVESTIVPGGDVASDFAYEVKVISAHDKSASASGSLTIQDNKTSDIRIGELKMQVSPRKVADGWEFAIEVRDTATNSLISSANITTDEKEGAQIRT